MILKKLVSFLPKASVKPIFIPFRFSFAHVKNGCGHEVALEVDFKKIL